MALKSSTLKETNTYEVEVFVEGAVFMDAVNKVYKKEAKKINVPGFRKGKAPRAVIEKLYGPEVFYDDAMQECYPEALDAACKDADLKVVTVTGLEATDVSKDGFTFVATVVVEPEIGIKDYKGIEVEKLSTEVTDEMIDEEIERVRERNSRMVTVEDRAAENGDTAVIDFEGFCDGEAFEGGKAEEYNLELGSGNFIPGFEEQIVGHNAGYEFTIAVKFPEEYQNEGLKGKDAQFKIKLHEIKNKELPEVDDDFVKDVSEKDTVAEYREELKEQVAKRLEGEAERDLDDSQQGMDLNTYMKYTGMDANAMAEMYKPEAERRVKMRLALEKIAQLEDIKPTQEDIDGEYAKMAEAYNMEADKIREIIPVESVTEDLGVQLAMKLIKDSAVIK